MAITWLVGKSSDVDILWNSYPYEITNSPDVIRNINLFEEKQYKYIYNKKDSKFFKQNHSTFYVNFIIKGVPSFDQSIMVNEFDTIIDIDSLCKTDLFSIFLKIVKIKFTKEEMFFVNQISSLEELSTLINLKNLNVEMQYWPSFIEKKRENWNQQFKDNTLIKFGILNPIQIIPIMIYSINSRSKQKPLLLFLHAKIKQGYSIWEFNKLWQSLI